jgi:hypothetical protein
LNDRIDAPFKVLSPVPFFVIVVLVTRSAELPPSALTLQLFFLLAHLFDL